MQTPQEQPLILTLRLDDASMEFFNRQRKQFFPPERNVLDAHLTLFHQLPNSVQTRAYFLQLHHPPFQLQVAGLMNLGGGVAYKLSSDQLLTLHHKISIDFKEVLIPQDRQGFRPHITIQNKVSADEARLLQAQLSSQFNPLSVEATGLDLWTYLGGPWQHEAFYAFA